MSKIEEFQQRVAAATGVLPDETTSNDALMAAEPELRKFASLVLLWRKSSGDPTLNELLPITERAMQNKDTSDHASRANGLLEFAQRVIEWHAKTGDPTINELLPLARSAISIATATAGREMPETQQAIQDSVLVIGTREDRNTILAALRFYQDHGMGEPANRSDAIHDLATNGEEDISYDADDINDLCERVNFAPMQHPRLTHADIHDAVLEVGLRPTFEQSWRLNELLDQKTLRHREDDFPGVEINASDKTAARASSPRM